MLIITLGINERNFGGTPGSKHVTTSFRHQNGRYELGLVVEDMSDVEITCIVCL